MQTLSKKATFDRKMRPRGFALAGNIGMTLKRTQRHQLSHRKTMLAEPACSFMYSATAADLTGSFRHSHPCIHAFNHAFLPSFIHSLVYLFNHSFVRLFIRSFIRALIHSLIHSLTHSFTYSFIQFIHSFTHSFIHSFIN